MVAQDVLKAQQEPQDVIYAVQTLLAGLYRASTIAKVAQAALDAKAAQPLLRALVANAAQAVASIKQQIYTIAKAAQVALDAQDAASQEYQQEQRHAQVQAELLAVEQ